MSFSIHEVGCGKGFRVESYISHNGHCPMICDTTFFRVTLPSLDFIDKISDIDNNKYRNFNITKIDFFKKVNLSVSSDCAKDKVIKLKKNVYIISNFMKRFNFKISNNNPEFEEKINKELRRHGFLFTVNTVEFYGRKELNDLKKHEKDVVKSKTRNEAPRHNKRFYYGK